MKQCINLILGPNDHLLPCPFCGSQDLELRNSWTASYKIECQGCEAEANGGHVGQDEYHRPNHTRAKKLAIEAWNRRTP